MKKIFLLLILASTFTFAQFKDQLDKQSSVRDGMISNNTPSMILGFINPNNFQMHHSYNLSYSAFGGNGLAMGVYTNSMVYKFNNQLNIQLDASLVHTPYSTFSKDVQDKFNGIYISRAELNYRPSDNFMINIQYNQLPYGSYYSPYGYWGSPYGYYNDFYSPGNRSRNTISNQWLYGK